MYTLLITDSSIAIYLFIVLPQISTNPNDVTVLTGRSSRLTCSALGTELKYQWLRNDKSLPGTNSNMLRLTKINESNEGIYKCMVSNKGGDVVSNPATVTVYGKLEIC